jgi:hypothetical protein
MLKVGTPFGNVRLSGLRIVGLSCLHSGVGHFAKQGFVEIGVDRQKLNITIPASPGSFHQREKPALHSDTFAINHFAAEPAHSNAF